MTEKERLTELFRIAEDMRNEGGTIEESVDFLLASGVIVPPVKVGDIVYTNLSMSGWYMRLKDRPYEAKVVYLGINGKSNYMNVAFVKNDNMISFNFYEIGKNVFLTREEAEKALAERSNTQ